MVHEVDRVPGDLVVTDLSPSCHLTFLFLNYPRNVLINWSLPRYISASNKRIGMKGFQCTKLIVLEQSFSVV